MSGRQKGAGVRVLQAGALIVLFGLLYGATKLAPTLHGIGVLAALGFLLIASTLLSELVGVLGVPHLTGYLTVGIVAGPYVVGLLDRPTAASLSSINTLALALIALEGGAELRAHTLRKLMRSLAASTLTQSVLVLLFTAAVFVSASQFIPFVAHLSLSARVAVGLLWGVLSITRSPSATLAVLAQTRARGPLATFALTFVMTSDIVVVILLAGALTLARTLLDPGASFSLSAFQDLGHDLMGSIALGTTLGLVLAAYIRLVHRQMLLVFLALGFGMTEVLHYVRFEPLLSFMVAGFVVQNLSHQGNRFLQEIEKLGSIVYVVFFATAGADLDLPLLSELWPIALLLAGSRGVITFVAGKIAGRMAKDPEAVQRFGFAPLLSQAGLALGIAAIMERNFPGFGPGFRALAIAMVAMNEMVGPILFKFTLDRSGETSADTP